MRWKHETTPQKRGRGTSVIGDCFPTREIEPKLPFIPILHSPSFVPIAARISSSPRPRAPASRGSSDRRWAAAGCAPSWGSWGSTPRTRSIRTASSGPSSTRKSVPFSIGSAPAFGLPMSSPPPNSHSITSSSFLFFLIAIYCVMREKLGITVVLGDVGWNVFLFGGFLDSLPQARCYCLLL